MVRPLSSCAAVPVLSVLLLAACSATPVVQAPLNVTPPTPPIHVERLHNGAIYQAGQGSASLFSTARRPRAIGDVIKVDIAEKLAASRKLTTDTSRENSVAVKGPGKSESGSKLVDFFGNLNASASGSDAFKGAGTTDNTSSFTGQMAASVINVLPNGHLVVAGERRIALNGGLSALRFSGVVDPQDLKAGNVIASSDVVNARFELAGEGDVSDAASRNWLQRVLTNQLSVW